MLRITCFYSITADPLIVYSFLLPLTCLFQTLNLSVHTFLRTRGSVRESIVT